MIRAPTHCKDSITVHVLPTQGHQNSGFVKQLKSRGSVQVVLHDESRILIFEKNCTRTVTHIVPNYLTLEYIRKTKNFAKVQ